LLASSLALTAQVAPARDVKKDVADAAKTSPAAAQPANVIPRPFAALSIEPSRPPVVAWDGRRLTIDAENSMLSDVLLAIRSRTGASIEMPGSASSERVAIHVGPAPIRDVLSSLLYGTNFNYVIQASEDDESGLGKVILISRDGDGSDDATTIEVKADRNVRLMRGYSAPGKRDFEVAHTRAMQEAENAASADSANQDGAPVATNDAGSNDAPSTDSQPVASNTNSTDSASAQPDTTLTAAEQPPSRPAAGIASASDASSTGDGAPSISNMEQNLQKMYEQRRQIQAQQNKGAQPTPPAP
jgi:hypothetical protein